VNIIVARFNTTSGAASPKIGGEFWGAKMFDFTRITLFCVEKNIYQSTK